ncbi:MarR family transcriptional regulator [Haladaptatus sp. F3-133]|jgi:predicted transcriptional regulator|uniref:MarR family transcriptional regulator n=1 Tax=Halorutilus salinus TaxID=2487751 RepID=A0A9Q4C305_9EURY|nr:helix-turn-helix domain-containing protein [Halorutilus salinus]MCX2818368.1 MarR family transcriptional regulator [Halorutilus salinus]
MEPTTVYRCEGCSELLLASEVARDACCGDVSEVTFEDAETRVEKPDSETVLKEMFGLGETSLEICFCVIDNEGATVSEVADEMEIDRSAVSRHVNRLVDAGILTKQERNLRQGGVVHVYEHEDPEVVKERLRLGAYLWISEVVDLIVELNDEKAEAMEDERGSVMEALGGRIWKEN